MNLLFLALLANVGAANAQSLDCAALQNSAAAEPTGYAEQCLNVSPSPRVSVGVNAPTDTAFTIDIRGQAGVATRLANSLYSFTLNAFPTQALRGVTNPSIFAMDFNVANTTLFGITGAAAVPNPASLGTINQTTGAFTVIAPLTGLTAGDGVSGLAINPVSGVAYIAAAGGTPSLSRLYTFNLTTGAATLVGQMTAPTDAAGTLMIDISMNCQGELYAHNISDDALYSINVATGAGTARPTHGLAANFAQGMDFDNQSGELYAFIYTGAGTNRFGTFNLTTGAFTSIATDNPLGEYEGAIPTSCPAAAGSAPTATIAATATLTGGAGTIPVTVATAGTAGGSLTLACTVPAGANAYTITTGANRTITAPAILGANAPAIGVSCTQPAGASTTATVTCTQTATPAGAALPALTSVVTCPAIEPTPTARIPVPTLGNISLMLLVAGFLGLGVILVARRQA